MCMSKCNAVILCSCSNLSLQVLNIFSLIVQGHFGPLILISLGIFDYFGAIFSLQVLIIFLALRFNPVHYSFANAASRNIKTECCTLKSTEMMSCKDSGVQPHICIELNLYWWYGGLGQLPVIQVSCSVYCKVNDKLVRIHYPVPCSSQYLSWVMPPVLQTLNLCKGKWASERPSSSPVATVLFWFSWETCSLKRSQFLDIFVLFLLVRWHFNKECSHDAVLVCPKI